jgi:hypothetical protein
MQGAGQDNVFAVLREYQKTHIDSIFVFLANVSLPVVSCVGIVQFMYVIIDLKESNCF